MGEKKDENQEIGTDYTRSGLDPDHHSRTPEQGLSGG